MVGKAGRMTFGQNLVDTMILFIELHAKFDLQCIGVSSVHSDCKENHPLIIGGGTIVDDLMKMLICVRI